MKSVLIFVLLGFNLCLLQAQSEQTIFKKSRVRGGFGGPTFSYSKVKGHEGYGAGGGGGVVFDNLFLGAYGSGELFDIQRVNASDYTLALGHGGLWVGYAFPTRSAIHLYASAKIGGGGVAISEQSKWWNDPDRLEFEEFDEAVFVALPEVGVELNLFHWMRVAGTIGYRYVDGFRGTPGLGQQDLSAPVYGLSVRFGWFGHRKAADADRMR